jgi:hypothetical protein
MFCNNGRNYKIYFARICNKLQRGSALTMAVEEHGREHHHHESRSYHRDIPAAQRTRIPPRRLVRVPARAVLEPISVLGDCRSQSSLFLRPNSFYARVWECSVAWDGRPLWRREQRCKSESIRQLFSWWSCGVFQEVCQARSRCFL